MGAVRHTRQTRARVIEHFRKTGRIDLACEKAGIARDTHYDWLKKDPAYKAAFDEALEPVADMLEAEAVRRGLHGVDRPVYSGGRRVYEVVFDADGKPKLDAEGKVIEAPAYVREYSDRMLELLLKGRRRHVFGDKIEATGKDGTPLFPVAALRAYMDTIPDDAE